VTSGRPDGGSPDELDLDGVESAVRAIAQAIPERINATPERVEHGLARLVLALIEVIRKVLEHQAVRRMDGGQLTDAELERLGLALLRLSNKMDEMKTLFGVTDDELEIDLGPLGRLL
jgi:hypothetical protein